MRRSQLEHIIRAAASITGANSVVVIGSQAVLGQFPSAPPELLISIEADVFTFRNPADADLIDGTIGEASPFHQTFGYYAHGVAEETAVLPQGWKERLIPVKNENTLGALGLCLEVHDLAVSKLIAGREKDISFLTGLIKHRLADADVIGARLRETEISNQVREHSVARLNRIVSSLAKCNP